MFLEFFLLRKNGMPVTELYRLDTDTVQEIRATILGAPFNLCLAALMPKNILEKQRLAQKVSEAQAGQRQVSQADIKALAKLTDEMTLANEWFTGQVSVLLSADTGSASKAVVWRGALVDVLNAADALAAKICPLAYSDTLAEHCTDIDAVDGKIAAPVPVPVPAKADDKPVVTMAEVIAEVKAIHVDKAASKPVLKITPNMAQAALDKASKVLRPKQA
jgi:hypothetical protein